MPRLVAHYQVGVTMFFKVYMASTQIHYTQALALYTPQAHRTLAVHYSLDLSVASHSYAAWALWLLGFPDQALQHSQAARTLAQEVAHPYSLATALRDAAVVVRFTKPDASRPMPPEVLAAMRAGDAVISGVGD